jgi:hypothetical protein
MPQNMTPEEIQARTDEYNQALASGIPITEELRDSIKDASVGIKGYSAQLRASKAALTASMGGLVKSLIDGESGAAVYNDTIKSGAKVFSDWNKDAKSGSNVLGKTAEVLAEVATRVATLADQQFKLYQDLSRSGLATGMNDAFKNLQAAGYTMKEIGAYGDLMKQNSTVLANMGGTAQEGLTRFSKISKEIVGSGLGTQLLNMGMQIPQINEGIANYVRLQQLSGQAVSNDTKAVTQGAMEYMVNQDKLTKLTGLSADSQNKIQEQALATEQYAAKTFELKQIAARGGDEGAAAQKKLDANQAMLTMVEGKMGPEMKKNAMMYLAGATNTEGYAVFQRGLGQTAQFIDQGGTDIGEFTNTLMKDVQRTTTTYKGLAGAGVFNKFLGNFGEYSKALSSSGIDYVDAVNSAGKQIEGQAAGKDKNTADMVKINQNARDIEQSTTKVLDKAMGPVTSALKALSTVAADAAGVLGKIAGKEGKIGGKSESSWYNPFSWFAEGGYTGDGGKYQPAGIVHKGEYVIDAETTKALGLNRSISSGPGYADGGLVKDPKNDPALGLNRSISSGPGYADGGLVKDPKNDPALAGIDIEKLHARINQLHAMVKSTIRPTDSPSMVAQKTRNRQDQLRTLSENAIYEQTGETSVAKLTESLAAYQKVMEQSAKQVTGAKGTTIELTDSFSDITEGQKENTQALAKTLNTSFTPVIKSFTLLTKTTDRLTELLESGTGEGKAEDTVGLIDKTKTLVLSTIDKIKQTLGFSPTATTSSGGTSGGAAGGAAGGAPNGAQKPKDTSPTEQVPSGSPPSAAEAKSAATPAAGSGGGTGKEEGVKPDVLAKKAAIESVLGKKLTVTSGFRPGAANHGTGDAIDLGFGANQLSEPERNKLYVKALDLGFNGIGAEYRAPGGAHIHLDTSHSGLMAWGSDYKWPPTGDSPFLTQLITDRRAGKTDTPMPSAAMGGILSGPTSGYQALLHGNEAVVPLPDGRTIPVQSKGGGTGSSAGAEEQISLLTQELSKLDSLLSVMTKQNNITDRMLQNQG